MAPLIVKWNQTEEEVFLRFAHRDETRSSSWGRPLADRECTFKHLGWMSRHQGSASSRRGGFSLDIPFYRTCPGTSL